MGVGAWGRGGWEEGAWRATFEIGGWVDAGQVEELVVQYPYRKGLSAEDRDKEAAVRLKYAHMLSGILQ